VRPENLLKEGERRKKGGRREGEGEEEGREKGGKSGVNGRGGEEKKREIGEVRF
jgi:hypothetical protein